MSPRLRDAYETGHTLEYIHLSKIGKARLQFCYSASPIKIPKSGNLLCQLTGIAVKRFVFLDV